MPDVSDNTTRKTKGGRKTGSQVRGSRIPADVMAYRRERIAHLTAGRTPQTTRRADMQDDTATAIEQIGVLRPGDRLIVRVHPQTTAGSCERLRDAAMELLPGVEVVVVAAEQLLIARAVEEAVTRENGWPLRVTAEQVKQAIRVLGLDHVPGLVTVDIGLDPITVVHQRGDGTYAERHYDPHDN